MDNSLSPVELAAPGVTSLSGVPEGFDALVLADLARLRAASANGLALIHIARDDQRLSALAAALRFFAPEIEVLTFPAWDCLPYDRVSPSPALVSQRFATLAMLASRAGEGGQDARERAPAVLLTTVNAAMQRLVPREVVRSQQRVIHPGNRIDLAEFAGWLSAHGYERSSMVRDPASFAVRGGIVDLFPAAAEQPVRLDFFGDTVESIRNFDAETQRSTSQLASLDLLPVSEALLTEIREELLEFPQAKKQRFQTEYLLSNYDAGVLVDQGQVYADYFETVARTCGDGKQAANWVTQDVQRELNERGLSIDRFWISAPVLGTLLQRIVSGELTNKGAREVFAAFLEQSPDGPTVADVDRLIEEMGLKPVTDSRAIETLIDAILDRNEKIVADVKGGKQQAAGPLIGQVMKELKGADPKQVRELLLARIALR